jgi:organic radical activating enzyme
LKLKDIKKFNPKAKKVSLPIIVDETNIDNFINYINDQFLSKFAITTILLTGGEPLMNKEFVGSLIYNKVSNLKNITKIEIETNGTLLNDKTDYMLFYHWDKTIQINISPKLDPSYYRSDKIKTIDDIIELFNNNRLISTDKIVEKSPTTITWKFVYSKAGEESIAKFIREVPNVSSISMMPLTPDYLTYDDEMKFLEAFRQSSYDTLEYCMKTGYVFSSRMHIWVFNNFKHRDEYVDVRKK